MLKLYIYGYLNRIQSSRRLAQETHRNLELIWLMERPIRNAVPPAGFVDGRDGSKFKAVNNRDKNFTTNEIKRRREQIEASIERYLSALETADRQDQVDFTAAKIQHLQEKIAQVKAQMAKLDTIETELQKTPDEPANNGETLFFDQGSAVEAIRDRRRSRVEDLSTG